MQEKIENKWKNDEWREVRSKERGEDIKETLLPT
jgi:hypothetical protein